MRFYVYLNDGKGWTCHRMGRKFRGFPTFRAAWNRVNNLRPKVDTRAVVSMSEQSPADPCFDWHSAEAIVI